MNAEEKRLPDISTARIAVKFIIWVTICAAGFFGAAGTWNYPQAWLYLATQFSFSITISIWLWRNNPQLLKERMTFMKKNVRGWDKIFITATLPIGIALLVLPGLDAVRYRWTVVPPAVQAVAFCAVAASLLVIFLVMRENTWLSRIVEIQRERGHQVITTGPYRFVRHPMYTSAIVYSLSLPLALGSWWGVIVGALMTVLFVIRTCLEDRTLHEELDGYGEYAARTRYRLLPRVW